MKKLVTIIVPIYKAENYLEDCIVSILNQTHTNLEIILVNDGSPDQCGAICDKYASLDNRIIVIHKENGGISDARNSGLAIAKGDFISFVDSDDVVGLNFIKFMLNEAIEKECDLVICELKKFQNNEEIKSNINSNAFKSEIYPNEYFINNLYHKSHILGIVVVWNKLYKKDLFKELRFPKNEVHEDEFIIHHILFSTKKIAYIYQPLYFYRIHMSSFMASGFSMIKHISILNAYEDRIQLAQQKGCKSLVKETKNFRSRKAFKDFRLSGYSKEIRNTFFNYVYENIRYLKQTKDYNLKEKLYIIKKIIK